MANVESKIVVNIKALVDGTSKVRELAEATTGLENATGKAAGSMSSSVNVGKNLDGMFGKLKTSTQGFAFALNGLGKEITQEFAPLSAAGAKIEEFVRKEQKAIADLERVKAQRAAISNREQFFAQGRDPFAQGVEKFGETPLGQAGQSVAGASLTTNAAANIQAMESQRAALRKMNEEAIRSGKEGSANINKLVASFKTVDQVRHFERLLKDGNLLRTGLQQNVNVAGLLRRALSPLAPLGRQIAGIFSLMVRQVQFAIAAFALLAAGAPIAGFGLLIKEGIEFNSIMEQQRIGLAALIQSTHDLFSNKEPNKPLDGVAAYTAATQIAEAATNRLRIKIIPLRATSEELLPIFNQIVTAGAAAGLTINQLEDTFVSLTSAAQILNIPTARLGTEIRLLLAGTTRETSRLGPALFGTAANAREFVKQHKAIGDLFPALQTKLVAYNAALDASEQSYATLKENTIETFQILSGIATKGIFEKIKQGLTIITRAFFDLKAGKLKTEFEALFLFINDALTKFGDYLLSLVTRIVGYITDIAKYVQDNQQYISAILGDIVSIAQQSAGLLVDIVSIVGQLVAARGETLTLHNLLGFIAITIGIIRDGWNSVIGILQVVGGTLVNWILLPMTKIVEFMGLFSDKAAEAAKNMQGIRNGATNFAESGAVRFASGFDLEASSKATTDFLNGNPGISAKQGSGPNLNDFNAKLRKGAGANAAGNSAAERLANRLAELKRRTAELGRQLFDTQIEIARSGEDRLFDIQKDASDRTLSTIETDLSHRLTSFQAYYTQKNKIELEQIEAEKKHLTEQFGFDKDLIQNRIDAINEKFQEESKAPKNKNPQIAAELETQRAIQVQEQRNNLKIKEVDLQKQIELLNAKTGDVQRKNNQDLSDALERQSIANQNIQADLIESQGRATDAELKRIAIQYSETIRETLANNEPASDALKSAIEEIANLGSVTSSEFKTVLSEAGIKFEELSNETKALIALITQLEQKAQFKGFETTFGVGTDRLNLRKDQIQDKVNLGVISEAEGRRQVALAEKEARIELEKVVELMSKLPGLTEQQKLEIDQMKQSTSTLGREFDVVGNTINGTIASGISNFGNQLLEGVDDLGAAFRGFFSGLLIDISKAIFQAVILKGILSALGLSGTGTAGAGSAGGIGGVLSGIFGGGLAEGGEVSGAGTGTSDSILARVSHGEWVVPAARVMQYGRGLMSSITSGTFGKFLKFAQGGPVAAHSGGSGVQGFTGVRNVNVLDPELLSNYMTSSAGERVMLNFISKNPGKVKRSLGL